MRHLRYDLASDHTGFFFNLFVRHSLSVATALVRVAAGRDEEGEVYQSIKEASN